jgi:hypothetical protein
LISPRAAAFAAAAVALGAAARPAAAQMPSLVDLSAQYTPPATLDGGAGPGVQISSYKITLNVPIPLSSTRFLIPGFAYRVDSVELSNTEPGASQHETYHGPELSVLFVQLLPKRWSLTVRGSAALVGGFDTIDRGKKYTGLALATHALSDRLTLGAGALVTGGLGDFLPLPVAMVKWEPTAELTVQAFVPAFAEARYVIRRRVELGARVEIAGSTYAVPADPDVPMDVDEHASYTVGSAGLLGGVRLTSTIWLTAFAGVGFYRDVEVGDDGHELPAAGFIRTNLTWRLPGG